MSKECATATLRESFSSRLQMSGGNSDGSRVRPHRWQSDKRQEAHNQHHGEPPAHKKTSNEIRQCLCEKLPVKSVSRANRSAEWPNKSFNLSSKNSNGFNFWRLTTRVCDSKDVDDSFVASHPWAGSESVNGWKLFTFKQDHNHQNNRSWCTEAPGTSAIVEHHQNSKFVMDWAGISATGKTPLVFVDEVGKIDKNVYRRDILDTMVVPWACHHFGQQQLMDTSTRQIQPTERKRRRSGTRNIFTTSSHLRNGRPTRQISTLWFAAFGQFRRPGPVLSPTKIWRLWSSRCSGGGTDCWRKSHGLEFSEAFDPVFWRRRWAASFKQIKYVIHKIIRYYYPLATIFCFAK